MVKSRLLLATVMLLAVFASVHEAQTRTRTTMASGDFEQTKTQAEAFIAEGSFKRAQTLYQDALVDDALSSEQRRWCEFRLADTSWRAALQDEENLAAARAELTALIEATPQHARDLVWAEAQESLADSWWTTERRNAGPAWTHYREALAWWAGSRDVELARERYLDMIWRMAEPARSRGRWYLQQQLPLDLVENAAKIAKRDGDRSRAHLLLAMTLQYNGNIYQQNRVAASFEAAIAQRNGNPWYDDGLFAYGQWLASRGPVRVLENGQWTQTPDFVRAVEVFRQLMNDFERGETAYYRDARQAIKQIEQPTLNAYVSNIFLPESRVQFGLQWRNLKKVDFELKRVNLLDAVDPTAKERLSAHGWMEAIDLRAAKTVRSWTYDTKDDGKHEHGGDSIVLEEPLPTGAYVLLASGTGAQTVRQLVLVTDLAVVLKAASERAVAYTCDAEDGSPVPGAKVRFIDWRYMQDRWAGADERTTGSAEGLATYEVQLDERSGRSGLLVLAEIDGRQAFALSNMPYVGSPARQWKIYAVTDRPAYRPEDTVQWKMTARRTTNDGYVTPSGAKLHYEISGPRGKVEEGQIELNVFGSGWASLDLSPSMALGEYTVTFWLGAKRDWVGAATLFRLEEYKLPEFEVTVATPEEDGRKKTFRLGDVVEVAIDASYYFGGPVADANVAVLVYQKQYWHFWVPERPYPWFYQDANQSRWHGYGSGSLVKQETVRTDDTGRATIFFETPVGANQDFEYTVEARVTDASRREVVASDSVRVTRQSYFLNLRPEHSIYRPGDEITIDIESMNANRQPVSIEGDVKVTREIWREVWLDSNGRRIEGEALETIRRSSRVFPPPPPAAPNVRPWSCIERGYRSETVLTKSITTDDDGQAQFAFVPEKTGHYRVAWTSLDPGRPPVTATTAAWVCTPDSTQLGFRHPGLEIVIDEDTAHSGASVPVMITVPTNDRWVLFTVEGRDLYRYELVHVTGTVKLIELDIPPAYVPNVTLFAMMAHDGRIQMDTKEIVVPPVDEFLEVAITPDGEVYEPGETGRYTITAKNADGEPVAAEIGLSVSDESVLAIQQDYAIDPRQFFYGERQPHYVASGSSFAQMTYVRLVEAPQGEGVIDERTAQRWNGNAPGSSVTIPDELFRGGGGGYGGGGAIFGDVASEADAPMGGARRMRGRAEKSQLAARAPAPSTAGMASADDESGGGAVQVRTDFRATLLWKPDLVTGPDGRATVELTYGDSLTRWGATARVCSADSQFGTASATTRTRMPIIARLQAPRFFVVGDTVTLSGVINNNTDQPELVQASLEVDGLDLDGVMVDGRLQSGPAYEIEVPANGEQRVDWIVTARTSGDARVKLVARGGKHADAMEKTYLVAEHGIEKFITASGKVRGDAVTVSLELPSARREGSTELVVQVTPSMAVTMLDALPYLVDYPYGCTEQTMSRFLPAAITAKTLRDVGLSPEDALGQVFGGIERDFVDETHGGEDRENLRKLDAIVRAGLDRLYDFQQGDGGWGWWKRGSSDHYMTAYVVWGLSLAKDAGLDVRDDVLTRGAAYLDLNLVEAENQLELQAWMLHGLSSAESVMDRRHERAGAAFDNLWSRRERLSSYGRALLALSAARLGDQDRAEVLLRNLENGVKRDDAPDVSIIVDRGRGGQAATLGTAHWGAKRGYWRWWEGGIESTAFALMAILELDPDHELVEPATNWLIKNRRGAQWSSTKDTAIVVLAMNKYLAASGELASDLDVEVLVNGHSVASQSFTDPLAAPVRLSVAAEHIQSGTNEIRIVRTRGDGPVYFAAEATFFSLEEPVAPAGSEIFVRRDYYKLSPRETLLSGVVYDRVHLGDGDYVRSGERIEVVLTMESKNDYEYLVFEDLKPAGFEATDVTSGRDLTVRELKRGAVQRMFDREESEIGADPTVRQPGTRPGDDYTGRSRWVHHELRDRKVAVFIDRLPEGTWEVRYDLRAEVPGRFHAMPVLGHAMYVPEIRCNSAEIRVTVQE